MWGLVEVCTVGILIEGGKWSAGVVDLDWIFMTTCVFACLQVCKMEGGGRGYRWFGGQLDLLVFVCSALFGKL